MSNTQPLFIKFENHKVPEFKEERGKDWILFGKDNLYPDYLIDLYLRSAKHNAIINAKTNYIYGGGLTIDDKTATVEQQAIANKFAEMFKSFSREMITDFELFNTVCIEVIWNKKGTRPAELNYIPVSRIRTNGDETEYYYSNDWSKNTRQDEEKTGFKVFKPFDVNKKDSVQLYVFKVKSPKKGKEKNVYAIPEYIGATASIETDIEIANYHLNNVKTGFSVGTIINFNNGDPGKEGREEIESKIKQKHTGTDKAGSLVITFNASQDNAPTITSFTPSDLDKQFIEISKRVEQDIFTGHKVTSPMLFGVKSEGQLGGRTEMVDAFELFQNTYINVRQTMLEEVINNFAELFNIVNKFYFKKVNAIKSSLPESLVLQAYTPDEVREALSLPPIKKSQSDNTKAVIDAINTLSPLVANKVLESMTGDEIRALVGLGKQNSILNQVPVQQPTQMSSDEKKKIDLKLFDNIGVNADEYEVLFARQFCKQSDEDCINEFNKMQFASELSSNERAIIDLLDKDPLMPSEGIAKVVKLTVKEVNAIIKDLVDNGLIKSGKPTKGATDIVEEDGAKTLNIEVKYKYDWRPNVTPDKTHSREFCVNLLNKNKLYSRAEIDMMNNEQGLDVWDSRGGWWNKDGANLPYCRHDWFQVVVKKK